MTATYDFILSGPGLIGSKHARLLADRPDCHLAAIVAPDSDENLAFAKACGAALFTDIGAALTAIRPDAAIISSPNAFHFDQVMTCIRQGVPVLVEKPVTDLVEDARTLADEVDRMGIPVLVGHHRTYSPLLDAAMSFLGTERFGRLVAVQGSALFYKPGHYFLDGPWRTRKGGGPILINLIHEIGLMRHFCGEIHSVFAFAGKNIRNFEVEDTVALNLEFENGALGNFILSDTAASSKSWEMTSGENPTYPHFPLENCYHFAGTNGSLDFPSMHARSYADPAKASWWEEFTPEVLEFTPEDPLRLQLDHFVAVLAGQARPKVSARDGYVNMLVIEAIMRSIETRSVIDMGALS